MSFYPEFDSPDEVTWALNLVLQKLRDDPEYLTRDECPYPPELCELILDNFAASPRPTSTPEDEDDGEAPAVWDGLEAETRGLYLDLKSARHKLRDNDASSQMSFFRTATSLLEKLVGLQERANSLRELHEFKEQVYKVIDSVLTDEQRQTVLSIYRQKEDADE